MDLVCQVKDVDTVMMEDPWVDAWKRGQITRAECAKMQTVATRSYNDGIVRSKIRNNEKQEIFWNTLESLCENNPELASHRMRYICVALQRKSSDEGELSTAGWWSKADAKAENDNVCDLVYLTISTFNISSSNIDTNNCDLVYLKMPSVLQKIGSSVTWTKLWCGDLTIPIVLFVHNNW